MNKNLDELFENAQEALEKAKKLTTKDRKKMKKSTFCGPGRSFPVPDCKHVSVAKTYLARSKFSESTKKKIAACINRKAKQLGCNVSKKTKANKSSKFIELSYEEKKLYSSNVFEATKKLVEDSRTNPNMDLDFNTIIIEE